MSTEDGHTIYWKVKHADPSLQYITAYKKFKLVPCVVNPQTNEVTELSTRFLKLKPTTFSGSRNLVTDARDPNSDEEPWFYFARAADYSTIELDDPSSGNFNYDFYARTGER